MIHKIREVRGEHYYIIDLLALKKYETINLEKCSPKNYSKLCLFYLLGVRFTPEYKLL